MDRVVIFLIRVIAERSYTTSRHRRTTVLAFRPGSRARRGRAEAVRLVVGAAARIRDVGQNADVGRVGIERDFQRLAPIAGVLDGLAGRRGELRVRAVVAGHSGGPGWHGEVVGSAAGGRGLPAVRRVEDVVGGPSWGRGGRRGRYGLARVAFGDCLAVGVIAQEGACVAGKARTGCGMATRRSRVYD